MKTCTPGMADMQFTVTVLLLVVCLLLFFLGLLSIFCICASQGSKALATPPTPPPTRAPHLLVVLAMFTALGMSQFWQSMPRLVLHLFISDHASVSAILADGLACGPS